MTDLIDRFCAEYGVYNSLTEDRIVNVAAQLRSLRDFAGVELVDLEAHQLRAYLTSRLESGRAATTVTKNLRQITPFYKWLWEQKLIDAERLMEFREIKPPRGGAYSGVPNPYKRKEIQRLWAELAERYPLGDSGQTQDLYARWLRGTTSWTKRVRLHHGRLQTEAIVALALYGGLRCGEIARLDLEEMHFDNSAVIAWSRKNQLAEWRPRPVPMWTPMRDAIQAWFEARAILLERQGLVHERPWVSLYSRYRGKPWGGQFDQLLDPIGDGHWSFHRLRHTAATEMLRSGMQLQEVQRILGHATMQQTLGYAQLVQGDILDAAERAEARYVGALRRRDEDDAMGHS